MARKEKYQIDEVIRFLSKRKGVKISGKVVEVSKRNDLGNSSWGRIDYLTNYCGYTALIKTV